ncbi:PAS domain-containing protein [Frigidibacter sp. RF13]|uniref:PAS domain-containing protein n=1 Tax=Frigidibacter sp. RF13 TaxID=2997340 RepID=UPI00226D42BE|nr:PAS domain-containing protein [Frigidibacter sp. RF13]MCY1125430.1 PAS domain-containing protein [Frigidibacter sp. RF13]
MDQDNIVPFAHVRTEMQYARISEVRAYWEALRNGRRVPLRSEIDPRGIERALEQAFILERIAPQVARFRLSGKALSELMGMEVRGMPFSALFTPGGRAELAEMIEGVFRLPQIAELDLTGETGFGRPPLTARLVLLPLQSDLGDISRALGCLVAEGLIGRAPRRFDISAARVTPIVEGRPTERSAPPPALARGFAESQIPYVPRPGRDRSHLRLVKSGE